jgi:hypothetical protein
MTESAYRYRPRPVQITQIAPPQRTGDAMNGSDINISTANRVSATNSLINRVLSCTLRSVIIASYSTSYRFETKSP